MNVENVLKTFRENAQKVTKLFLEVVPRIAKEDWSQEINELKVRFAMVELKYNLRLRHALQMQVIGNSFGFYFHVSNNAFILYPI